MEGRIVAALAAERERLGTSVAAQTDVCSVCHNALTHSACDPHQYDDIHALCVDVRDYEELRSERDQLAVRQADMKQCYDRLVTQVATMERENQQLRWALLTTQEDGVAGASP